MVPGDLLVEIWDTGETPEVCAWRPPGDLKNTGSVVGTPSKYLGELGSSLVDFGFPLSWACFMIAWNIM